MRVYGPREWEVCENADELSAVEERQGVPVPMFRTTSWTEATLVRLLIFTTQTHAAVTSNLLPHAAVLSL